MLFVDWYAIWLQEPFLRMWYFFMMEKVRWSKFLYKETLAIVSNGKNKKCTWSQIVLVPFRFFDQDMKSKRYQHIKILWCKLASKKSRHIRYCAWRHYFHSKLHLLSLDVLNSNIISYSWHRKCSALTKQEIPFSVFGLQYHHLLYPLLLKLISIVYEIILVPTREW